jgi:hypothetical protein
MELQVLAGTLVAFAFNVADAAVHMAKSYINPFSAINLPSALDMRLTTTTTSRTSTSFMRRT